MRELLNYNAGMITVKDELKVWKPLYLSQACIIGLSFFDVVLMECNNEFDIGISIGENRASEDVQYNKGTIVISLPRLSVYVDGRRAHESELRMLEGDRLRVTVDPKEHRVKWEVIYPKQELISNAAIPEHLWTRNWYPFVGLGGNYRGSLALL